MKYLRGTRGESAIENTTMEESCEYDYRYVSRPWIGFERGNSFVTGPGGHTKIHDDQIGTGRSSLLYGLESARCFNRFIARFFEAKHQQFSYRGIIIHDENLAFYRAGTGTHHRSL
jgi:hypothetical protein